MTRAPLISRSVLSDQVKDRLLQLILTGHYPPGSRIVETRVARELGVSQAPVREALRDLEALGVVEITAFLGARVRKPSKAELLEAFDVRSELESLGARLALSKLTDADVLELEELLDAMRRASRAGDTHEEATIDAAFHGRIIAISGNGTLERLWRYLEPVSRTYITLVSPGVDLGAIADLHGPVLEALRLRDADRVAGAIENHFSVVGALFASHFVEPAPDGDAAEQEAAISAQPPTSEVAELREPAAAR